MPAYKFQVFIKIIINTMNFPQVFYGTTEVNDMLNSVNKDIFNFVGNIVTD